MTGDAMNGNACLKTGVLGAAVTALCCFTPALVVLLGALGLTAWLGWIDYALLPALAAFIGLAVYGALRRRRAQGG